MSSAFLPGRGPLKSCLKKTPTSYAPGSYNPPSTYNPCNAPTRPNYGYSNQNPTVSSSPSLVSRLGSGLKNWRDQAGTQIRNWLSPSSWTSPSTPSANSGSVWSTPPAPNINTGTGPTWGPNTAPYSGWSAPVQPSSGAGSAWPTPPAPGTSAGSGWPAPPPLNVGASPISPSVPSSYYGPSTGAGTAPTATSQTPTSSSGKKGVRITDASVQQKERERPEQQTSYADPKGPLTPFRVERKAMEMRGRIKELLLTVQGTATDAEIDEILPGALLIQLGEELNTIEWTDQAWRKRAKAPSESVTVALKTREEQAAWEAYVLSTVGLHNPKTGEPASKEAQHEWFKKNCDTTHAKIDSKTPKSLTDKLSALRSGLSLSDINSSNSRRAADMWKIKSEIESSGGSEKDVLAAWKSKFGSPQGTIVTELEGGAVVSNLMGGTATGKGKDGTIVTVTCGGGPKFRPEGTKVELDTNIPHPFYATPKNIAAFKNLEQRLKQAKESQAAKSSSNPSSNPSSKPSSGSSSSSGSFKLPESKNGAKSLSDLSSKPKPEKPISWCGRSLSEWASLAPDEASAQKRGASAEKMSELFQCKLGIDEPTATEATSWFFDKMATASEQPDTKSILTEMSSHFTARGKKISPQELIKVMAPG